MTETTRRSFLLGAGSALLFVASGCGDGDRSDNTAAGGVPGGAPAARPVDTPLGTVEVPAEPRRVLTVEGRRDFESMIALGFVPVAAGYQGDPDAPFAPHLEIDIAGIDLPFEANAENLEAIASLRPDLIVGRRSNVEDLYAELSAIAPVLTVEGGGDWKADLSSLAAALGREDVARDRINGYEDLLAEVSERHAERIASSKIGIFQYQDGQISWSAPKGFYLQSQVLDELGGHQPDILAAAAIDTLDDSAEMSGERLGDLAGADALVVIANLLDGQDDFSELRANPLWAGLPAVVGGRVVRTTFWTNYGSVHAAEACLGLLDQAYRSIA